MAAKKSGKVTRVAPSADASQDKPKTPSQRLEEIGIEAICDYITSFESLRSWCIANGFNLRTVNNWIDSDKARATHYARARDDRADAVFDSLDDLAEQATRAKTAVEVNGLRLKADTIKWKLARMHPKKYGDRLNLDADVTVNQLSPEERAARIAALTAKLGV